MTANGWRKRQIADLHSDEVITDRTTIEDEITMLELMIYNTSGNVNAEMGVDLKASLELAKARLSSLSS